MKILIQQNTVDEDLIVRESKKQREIELPIRWHKTSKDFGFSMNKDGKGSYFGGNQMFGGPRSGELVYFDTAEPPYIAIIDFWTQDHVSRKCKLSFLCWKSDFWNYLQEGFIQAGIKGELEDKEIMQYSWSTLGSELAIDIQFAISETRINNFIKTL